MRLSFPHAAVATALVLSTLACGSAARAPRDPARKHDHHDDGVHDIAAAGAGSATPNQTALDMPAPTLPPTAITTTASSSTFEHHEWWGRPVFVPPKAAVPRPALRRAYVRCVFVYDPHDTDLRDSYREHFRRTLSCRAVKAGALATRVQPAVAGWLASALALTDGPVDATLASEYERAYDPNRSPEMVRPKDPFPTGTLVYVETEVRIRVRETIPFVCPPKSDHPCDPPGPSYTGRESTKVERVELAAWLGGRNTFVPIEQRKWQPYEIEPLLTLLGGGLRELPAVLIVIAQLPGAQPPGASLPGVPPMSIETPSAARATRTYLAHATGADADTRLALAFDRASVAIYWRDTAGLAAAMRALDAVLAARHGAPLPVIHARVFAKYLDTYRQLADGRLLLQAPLGLEPLVAYYFE